MSGESKAVRPIEKGFCIIADLFSIAGGIALFILMGVTVISVFWRYVLRDHIFGIEDISTMSLSIIVAASVAYGAIHSAHVSVGVVTSFGGRKLTRVTDAFARIAGICITTYAAIGLVEKGSCGMPCGAITPNLTILHTPFYYTLAFAMIVYAAFLFYHLIVGLAHWSENDPNGMYS